MVAPRGVPYKENMYFLPGDRYLAPIDVKVCMTAAHSSTASVPMTVLLYDGPLLCSFNVAIKGLKNQRN